MVKKVVKTDKEGLVVKIEERVCNRPFREFNLKAFQEDQEREHQAFLAKQAEKKSKLNEIDAAILSLKKEDVSLKKKYNKIATGNWVYVEKFKAKTDPIIQSLLDIEEKIIKLQKERNKLMGRR